MKPESPEDTGHLQERGTRSVKVRFVVLNRQKRKNKTEPQRENIKMNFKNEQQLSWCQEFKTEANRSLWTNEKQKENKAPYNW